MYFIAACLPDPYRDDQWVEEYLLKEKNAIKKVLLSFHRMGCFGHSAAIPLHR